jgi:DNA-binding GntR family transcriptional regulator
VTSTHATIRDDLSRRIIAGEFSLGEMLPGLDALREHYQSEDSAVRRALHELASEGLIRLNLQAIVAG